MKTKQIYLEKNICKNSHNLIVSSDNNLEMPSFDTQKTALLVIDMQYDYCSGDGKMAKVHNFTLKKVNKLISKLPAFIKRLKESGVLIIYTRMIEDPLFVMPNLKDKMSSFGTPFNLCTPDTKGFDYYGVMPQDDDFQIIKNTYDAFVSEDSYTLLRSKGISTELLETILQKHQINSLIFSGVLTSRCVDATLRNAFNRGYHCIVPEDLVAVPDQLFFEHRATLNIWRTIFAYIAKSKNIQIQKQNRYEVEMFSAEFNSSVDTETESKFRDLLQKNASNNN